MESHPECGNSARAHVWPATVCCALCLHWTDRGDPVHTACHWQCWTLCIYSHTEKLRCSKQYGWDRLRRRRTGSLSYRRGHLKAVRIRKIFWQKAHEGFDTNKDGLPDCVTDLYLTMNGERVGGMTVGRTSESDWKKRSTWGRKEGDEDTLYKKLECVIVFNLYYGTCEQRKKFCWCNILSVGLHVSR